MRLLISLTSLKEQWSPVFTLKSSLISLQSLLQSPEPNDPQDAEVARHYLSDKDGFDKTATYWTATYASPQGHEAATNEAELYGIDKDLVEQFENMGFSQPKIIEVLRRLGIKKAADTNEASNNRVLEELLKD
jgi:ubiquitin-conjugating enzyme (huntingtin interacting protein 2)